MTTRQTTSLSSITLTAREHEEMRSCIERIRRLGIRDNRLTNLTDRISVTLKKGARRAHKSATRKRNAETGTITLFNNDVLNLGL